MNERYRKLDEFLDRAFANTPNTVEANEIKLDIAGNLRQQYDELIASGMSDEEAFAQTCDSLGDPAELFGPAKEPARTAAAPAPRVGLRRLLLAVGIFLCAACWLPTAILAVCGAEGGWIAAPLFLLVALGVFGIIYSGTFRPGCEQDRLRYLLVASGVAAEVLCVFPVLVFESAVGIALMLLLIVVGVGLIVAGGIFRLVPQNGENTAEPPTVSATPATGTAAEGKGGVSAGTGDTAAFSSHERTRNTRTGERRPAPLWRICLWIGTLCLYLLLSFLTGAWSVTWILFLVGVTADVGIDNWLKLKNENDRP